MPSAGQHMSYDSSLRVGSRLRQRLMMMVMMHTLSPEIKND